MDTGAKGSGGLDTLFDIFLKKESTCLPTN